MKELFEKEISDENFKKYQGKYFDESWYKTIISTDSDGYYFENNIKKVLFKFRKTVIPDKLSDIAIDSFKLLSKKNIQIVE